jgi:Uma2 family endonuclease
MGATTRLITYEDSLAMPENRFEEIVNGESHIMPPPTDRHSYLLRRLTRILDAQLSVDYEVHSGMGLGIRRRPVLTYRIPDLTVFQIAVLEQDTAEKAPNDPYLWKAPELIAECLSPANRRGKLASLLADYVAIGVPEVWLINPQNREVAVHGLEGETERLREGHVRSGRLGVTVDLAELWNAYDRVFRRP